jgi:hypothetical protein
LQILRFRAIIILGTYNEKEENTMGVAVPAIIQAREARDRMAAAALTMLHTAGAELLDPDFDPWGIGSPA